MGTKCEREKRRTSRSRKRNGEGSVHSCGGLNVFSKGCPDAITGAQENVTLPGRRYFAAVVNCGNWIVSVDPL